MIKERELLKEFIDFVDSYEFYPTERNIIWEIVSRTQELLAQPEQDNIQYLLDQVARLTAENAMLKEKWSTSKPEPLSDGATADMYHANKKATHPDSYWSGVYDAEKAHGIGGGNE